MNSSYWQLSGDRATLSIGELRAAVSPSRPFDGLREVAWLGMPFPAARLLAVRTDTVAPGHPETVADAYVRGSDLVATYVQSPPRSVRPQIYWRAVDLGTPREPIAGCELLISMQTSLLDSDPGLTTETELAAGEIRLGRGEDWRVVSLSDGGSSEGAGPMLFRFAESQWSYAEMVHPADFLGFDLASTGVGARLRFRLFGERLEKGVIRRVRVRGLFVPRRRDEEAATEAYRHLAREPLPLTT